MLEYFRELSFSLDLVAFLVTIALHLVKTNRNIIRLYAIQSLMVASFLFLVGIAEGSSGFLFVAVLTLCIKVIIAPLFFSRLVRRYGSRFTVNNYLSTPWTLIVLMGLVFFSYSQIFLPLGMLVPEAYGVFPLNLALIFVSIFMLINRRGAFSQMIGILSLENSILLLATFIGIHQPIALEMGIVFDVVIWMIIAQVFISMIYRQFGSLNVTKMKNLTEE